MTESTPDRPQTDESLILDIASTHGQGEDTLFANLSAETAVGQVLLLDYDTATLAVHDYYKERVGGLARGMFLLSGSLPSGEVLAFVLMRVTGAKRLANQTTTDEARLTAARESIGQKLWSEKLTTWGCGRNRLGRCRGSNPRNANLASRQDVEVCRGHWPTTTPREGPTFGSQQVPCWRAS